jgi:hypothetical protein
MVRQICLTIMEPPAGWVGLVDEGREGRKERTADISLLRIVADDVDALDLFLM